MIILCEGSLNGRSNLLTACITQHFFPIGRKRISIDTPVIATVDLYCVVHAGNQDYVELVKAVLSLNILLFPLL